MDFWKPLHVKSTISVEDSPTISLQHYYQDYLSKIRSWHEFD
jgi:hypothetical protein